MSTAQQVWLALHGLPLLWLVWFFWKLWRKHRRFRAVIREVEKAQRMMEQSKTVGTLNARYERVQELLEHAREIAKR